MSEIEVGAFEAKTHLSQLLDRVAQGDTVRITRRGKPVALLIQDENASRRDSLRALKAIRSFSNKTYSLSEVIEFRDEGRER